MTASGLGDVPVEVPGIGPSSRTAFVQLLIRTGVLRVITFVGSIVLARLLLPSDYGIFAVVVFFVGILVPFADLGLGAALIQKREQPNDIEIATAFTAQQVVWLLLVALIWVLAPLIDRLVADVPGGADWMLRVTALAILIAQLQSVPHAMMSRVLRFGPLAAIEVVQQVVYLVVAIALALNGAGAWAFVIAILAQYIVSTVLTYVAWGRLPGLGIDRAALRRLRGFAAVFQLANLTHLLREALIPLFGGLAGGVTAIGHLQFGQRLGRLVAGLDEVAARVSFPAFSRLQDDRARTSRVFVYAVESTALGMALVWWPIAAAATLIPVLFGDTWGPAVPVFQLTALASLLGPPTHFLRGIGYAAGRGDSLLRWSGLSAGVAFVLFPPLVIAFGLVGGGIGFVVYAVMQLIGSAYPARHDAQLPWARLGRIHLLGLVAALPSALVLQYLTGLPGLIVSAIVFLAGYAALVLLFERDQLRRAWHMLRTGTALYDLEPASD